jgi:hypothetical protein
MPRITASLQKQAKIFALKQKKGATVVIIQDKAGNIVDNVKGF